MCVCFCLKQASNNALAAEKTRMDVLLARQYNLISCMAEESASMDNSRKGSSLEEKTLGGSSECLISGQRRVPGLLARLPA